jgi:predicted ribosome quality control (RQC) complex YloA/Tae2 family protein
MRRLSDDPSALEDVAGLIPPPSRRKQRPGAGPALPYRRYRTSGGLEVRVGRGSRANDNLTLHHSSPEDIWMHARDVAGAHVVLRWGRREENPPARDIAEAATLAALRSRARTSGTVPVDWTRRKYVRKPRKAPPGLVTLERAQTVFVAPDAGLEERLRAP